MGTRPVHHIYEPRNFNLHPTAAPLPPAPPRMVPPPRSEHLADDRTMAVPMVGGVGEHSWMVFDSAGLCRKLVFFYDEAPMTRRDYEALGAFEAERRALGDPLFGEDTSAQRAQAAALAMPGQPGELTHGLVEYLPVVVDELNTALVAPDGTYTVEVAFFGRVAAVLVLDDDGDIVDGCTAWDCDKDEACPEMQRLTREFLYRRIAAADPFVELAMRSGKPAPCVRRSA